MNIYERLRSMVYVSRLYVWSPSEYPQGWQLISQ